MKESMGMQAVVGSSRDPDDFNKPKMAIYIFVKEEHN